MSDMISKMINKAMNPDYSTISVGDVVYDMVVLDGNWSIRTTQVLLINDSEITLLTMDKKQIKYHKQQFNKQFFVLYTKALEVVNELSEK